MNNKKLGRKFATENINAQAAREAIAIVEGFPTTKLVNASDVEVIELFETLSRNMKDEVVSEMVENYEQALVNEFEFEELEKDVQEKIIDEEMSSLNDCLDLDLFVEFAHEKIRKAGFGNDVDTLEYSLSYSQGDGVAFYGTVYEGETAVLFDEFLQKNNIKISNNFAQFIKDNTYFRIVRNRWGYHYSHYNTMDVEIENDYFSDEIEEFTEFQTSEEGHEKVNSLLNEFNVFLTKKVQNLSSELETLGYNYIEEQTSRETALQNLKEVGQYYTINGLPL